MSSSTAASALCGGLAHGVAMAAADGGVPAGRPVRDLADQAPHALHEAAGALHALLGPDHVALGRRVGQHEPARRVGAVAPMMSSGSTVFFFDFDIFSIEPISIGAPVSTWKARRALPSLSMRTSPASAQAPSRVPVGLVHHHALREQAGERLVEAGMCPVSSSRA